MIKSSPRPSSFYACLPFSLGVCPNSDSTNWLTMTIDAMSPAKEKAELIRQAIR